MDRSFGLALKDWRRRRRVSQLALSGEANVSARHIAFLETGRARPSRGMVLQLSEALAIPRAERNALLQAAGFAPAYKARDFADADVAALRQAMDWTLSRHDPYPAMALDRHWKLVALNRAAAGLLAPLGLGEGESLLAAFASEHPLWTVIENASETARHLAARLRVESAHVGGDPVLDAAAPPLRRACAMSPSARRLPACGPADAAQDGRSGPGSDWREVGRQPLGGRQEQLALYARVADLRLRHPGGSGRP